MNILDTRMIITGFGIIFLILGINCSYQLERHHREMYELAAEHYAFEEYNMVMRRGVLAMEMPSFRKVGADRLSQLFGASAEQLESVASANQGAIKDAQSDVTVEDSANE